MSIKKLVLDMYYNVQKGDEWLDSVPSSIRTAFFENEYVNAYIKNADILLTELVGKEARDWVDWMIYEWANNKSLCVIDNGEEKPFNTPEEVLEYIASIYNWE